MNLLSRNEICSCGHYGGNSIHQEHKPNFQSGHGECRLCDCLQFTWVGRE